jgi:hypothetical protein
VAVIREKLEHPIEQLHGFTDVCFGHWFDRSRSGGTRQIKLSPEAASCTAALLLKTYRAR